MKAAPAVFAALLLVACGQADGERATPATAAVPDLPRHVEGPALLIYSGTGGWRHEDGIAGGNLALIELAREAGLRPFTTEDPRHFTPGRLDLFEAVVLNSATGVTLNADQQDALEAWVEGGGALVALHGSGDASHADWPWYQDTLIGPAFIGHPMEPQFQTTRVDALRDHPVAVGLEGGFDHEDEWYSFDGLPGEGFLNVFGITETAFAPILREGAAPSDNPSGHPVVWVACPGEGRSVYSALGHSAEAFASPDHRRLLANAIDWTRSDDGIGCP